MGLPLIFKSPIDRLLLVGCHPYITANTLVVLQRKQLLNFLSSSWIRVKLLLNGKIGKNKLILCYWNLKRSIIQLRPSLGTPQYSAATYFPLFSNSILVM
jgi:hypothetical protein